MEELVVRYDRLGWSRDEIAQLAYSLAEQIHMHSCALRGAASHSSSKPDLDVAIAMLVGLFDGGRYLERVPHV
jgi:hypothetical protein